MNDLSHLQRRPLLTTEACFYHLARLSNIDSGELLTLARAPDLKLLSKALEHTRRAHPLSRALLVPPRWWRRGHWLIEPAPDPLVIEERTLPEGISVGRGEPSDEELSSLCAELWRRPSSLGDQVPVSLTIYRSPGSARTFLLIRCPHFATDAYAGARFASDLLENYGALERGEPPVKGGQTIGCPSGEHSDPFQRLEVSPLQKLIAAFSAPLSLIRDFLTPASGFGFPERPRGASRLLRIRLEEPALQRLRAAARLGGITAHTLFSAALARLRSHHRPDAPPLRFVDLSDLRPLIAPEEREQLACLVLPFSQTLPRAADARGARGERALRRLMRSIKALRGGRALAEFYRLRLYVFFARCLPLERISAGLFRWVLKTDLVTTNPGPVPFSFERCGSIPVLDFINFPNISGGARLGLIYTTFRGALRILCIADSAALTEGEQRAPLQALTGEIEGLIEEIEEGALRPLPARLAAPRPVSLASFEEVATLSPQVKES